MRKMIGGRGWAHRGKQTAGFPEDCARAAPVEVHVRNADRNQGTQWGGGGGGGAPQDGKKTESLSCTALQSSPPAPPLPSLHAAAALPDVLLGERGRPDSYLLVSTTG